MLKRNPAPSAAVSVPAAVRVALVCLLASWAVTGCLDTLALGNLPGHVTFVGPHTASSEGDAVITRFGVADPEGDFVEVAVEVCTDAGACYVPELLPGSALLETLPTESDEASSALPLIWSPDCTVQTTTTPFTVTVTALGSDIDGVTSAPETLTALGVTCP